MEHDWSWRFPRTGASADEISRRLDVAENANINYEEDVVLGFPGTTPLPEAVEAYHRFLNRQPNNIGFHTGPSQTEIGFQGTQVLEQEFIHAIGSLAGATNPCDIDGYICHGGTEGNDHGIWMGKQKLISTPNSGNDREGIAVVTSFLTHYSAKKAFNRLLGESNGHRFFIMPTNERGEVTPDIVEKSVYRLLGEGFSRLILVLNAGTTNLGSVDQIDKINAKLLTIREVTSYIHVDAAFGGFVLPFLEPDCHFGFENKLVGSISLDAHKMGYVPYGACIFLTRKGYLEKYTRTDAVYLGGHADYTVCGSRSGAVAASCWAAMNTLGYDGYHARMKRCMRTLQYLRDRLNEFNQDGSENVFLYPVRLNVQTVRLSQCLVKALETAEARRGKPFCIPHDNFPENLTAPPDDAILPSSPMIVVHRFVVTPTVTKEKIGIFISALRDELTRTA